MCRGSGGRRRAPGPVVAVLFAVAGCLLLLPACACSVPAEPRGLVPASRAIAGGVPDAGHPAVGALILASGTCTAVQVAPRIVLTAAHCLQSGGPVGYVPGPDAGGAQIDVVDWRAHPDHGPRAENGQTVAWHDVGLVLLAADAPGPPLRWLRALPAGFVGSTITLVGFGETADGPPGSKQRADVVVSEVWSHGYWNRVDAASPATACEGDSGGPSLVTTDEGEAIVGVVSAGDAVCASAAYHARLDVDSDFLDGVLAEWEDAGPDGDGEDAPDADVPGIPDAPADTLADADLGAGDVPGSEFPADLDTDPGGPEDESPGLDPADTPPDPPGGEEAIPRDSPGDGAVPDDALEPAGSGGCTAGAARPDPIASGALLLVVLALLFRPPSRRGQSWRGNPVRS